MKKIEEAIAKLLRKEPDEFLTRETQEKHLKKLKTKQADLKNFAKALNKAQAEGKKTLNKTDKDASVLRHKDSRTCPSYNHQSAVDGKHGVTLAVVDLP